MCDRCEFSDLLEKIEEMLTSEEYEWARGTLEGIYNTVEENGHATDRQKEAVENIERKGK